MIHLLILQFPSEISKTDLFILLFLNQGSGIVQ